MGWPFHWGAWHNRGSEGVRACAENGVRRRKACVGRAWGVRGACVGWHARAVQRAVRCKGSCGARGARGRVVQGVVRCKGCEGSCGARGRAVQGVRGVVCRRRQPTSPALASSSGPRSSWVAM